MFCVSCLFCFEFDVIFKDFLKHLCNYCCACARIKLFVRTLLRVRKNMLPHIKKNVLGVTETRKTENKKIYQVHESFMTFQRFVSEFWY